MARIARHTATVTTTAKRLQLKPYVRLPRALLSHPPIWRRHTDAGLCYLPPFEFGIMAAAIVVGSAQWHRDISAQAFRASGKQQLLLHDKIARNRANYDLELPSKPPFDGRRQTSQELFEKFGRRKFHRSRQRRMQKGPPSTVRAEVTASTLLTCVGLHSNGGNHRDLENALDRLLKPVSDRPPVLASWEPLANKRVRLEVHGSWIYSDEPFKYLPLPLPFRSASVLALFLFLSSLQWTNGTNKHNISFVALFERLGLRHRKQGYDRLSTTLNIALQHINTYLASLPDGNLKALPRVVAHYEIKPLGDKVQFLGQPRRLEERREMEEHLADIAELAHDQPDESEEIDAAAQWYQELKQAHQDRQRRRERELERQRIKDQEAEDEGDFQPRSAVAQRLLRQNT